MFDKLWSKFVLQLNQKSPFFACLALFTKLVPDQRIEIGVTGGRELRVNPDFLLTLSDESAFSYLLHQVMHLALQHGTRRHGRDYELWNIAADIVINEMIVEATNWPTAPMTAWDNRFKAQSVEQVYAILAAEQIPCSLPGPGVPQEISADDETGEGQQDGQAASEEAADNADDEGVADSKNGQGSSADASGQGSAEQGAESPTSLDVNASGAASDSDGSASNQDIPNPGSQPTPHPLAKLYGSRADLARDSGEQSQAENADDMRYWNDAVTQAQTIAETRQQGVLPAVMQREFDRIARSRVDWRRELWRFVSDRQSDFTEFDNRHIHRGLYVEELRVDGLGVVVAIDTSASIGADELGVFMKELEALQKLHLDINVMLYFCDEQVHGPYKLSAKKPPTEVPVGGGGTSFVPVFDTVNKLDLIEKPDCLIYFTDGFGDFPDSPPAYPVLWVLCRDGCEESDVPFGMTIRVPYGDNAIQR